MFRTTLPPVAAAFALLISIMASSARGRPSTGQDTVDVRHVMDAFHAAVVGHDGARLGALFVPEGSTWSNVLSDQGYAAARSRTPDAPKVRWSSYKSFISFVSNSKAALDPQHVNVRVLSDGTIASVYFDFRFMIDGREQNRGSETWQLLKGAEGWRIAAITYSSTPPSR